MATIVMESAKVIEACEATITRIESYRKEKDEAKIAGVMATKIFVGWFKRDYPTREQAIKYLDNNRDHFFGWRNCTGWSDLAHAKKLLTLAKHGDPVTLNEEDCHVLF